MVSGGCIITGSKVKRSVLFSSVSVHSYSTIKEAVILPEVQIERNCKIRRVIFDRGCRIPQGSVIGYDHEQDTRNGFRVSDNGIVLVTKGMLGQRTGFA